MKRVKESGASSRNKRRAKLENIRKNEGALLKYVKSPVPEMSDSTLGLNSSKTTGPSNLEQAKKIQELDTVDLVPVRNVDIVPEDQIPTTSTQLESASVCLDMDLDSLETETDTASALSAIQYRNLDDIGKWPEHIDENMQLHLIQQGQEVVQHINTNFAVASTVTRSDSCSLTSKGETRQLTHQEWFYRTLTNGEKVLHTWMAYSPSNASLFCFCCRLFENVNTPNGSKFCSCDGFNTWWKLNPKVSSHESSALHNQNYCKWKELETRLKKGQTIDKIEQNLVAEETKKWQEILIRMFDIIKFLAKQNLALRGHTENDTSTNRGNFLELVHLIAKYDPVLREHLVRSKMCGKISITYMSPEIQNEFIAILGNKVRQHIIGQIKKAKYYSIIFNSTPDISHKDQTSQVLRYIVIENQEVQVVESFIDFIETKDKTAEGISKMILSKLEADGLDISNCRGQAYDNAAVMAGRHSGVQQRIKEINPKVEFVPCSNHSLNLVCLHAASVEASSVTFFGN
ncbi:zinc finger MYM-type protein 1-like [Erpetoichthys calabaricus]|uniref:zinc finger MYM-type protein 1-like n=1 Tax=Erpetoichthys calabaricus TaxID=27687 RepID=UPI002234274D|nr:zinc finger MYM-type protein 1-like [Erpetoichthys calabaricus]